MTNDTKAPEKELMKALEKSVNFLDDTPEELYALFNPDEKFIHATPDKTFSTNVSLQCDYRIVEYVPKSELEALKHDMERLMEANSELLNEVEDLATMLKRLTRALKNNGQCNELVATATAYLVNHGLVGSPLRRRDRGG